MTDIYDPNFIRRKSDVEMGGRFRNVDLGNCLLRVDLDDHIGYRTFIQREPFEQAVYHLARQLSLGRSDIILDIGANIGTASVPACAEFGCELIAVEASRGNAAVLLENISMNNVEADVHVLALTDYAKGAVPLYVRPGNRGSNSLLKDWSPSRCGEDYEMVQTSSVDELISSDLIHRIKIVKIDVEGAEVDVLRGSKRFLQLNKAPVLMEWRIDAVREYLQSNLDEILNLMSDYSVEGLKDGRRIAFDPAKSYENVLFSRLTS